MDFAINTAYYVSTPFTTFFKLCYNDFMKAKEIFFKYHTLFYGLICLLANILAVLTSDFTNLPLPDNEPLRQWNVFISSHSFVVNILGTFSYIVPVVLCVLHTFKYAKYPDGENKIKFNVQLPGAFAIRGISGWISNFFLEFIILIYLKITQNLDVTFIFISTTTSYIFLSMISFTLIYFSLETLNRNVVLPHLYPDGNISGTARMSLSSIKNMFLFYFFSAAVFPASFLGIRLFFTKRYNMQLPNYHDFIFTFFLLLLGLALTILFINFFQKPLEKLTYSANEISKSNYDCKTVICSNDEMGILGDSFNVMAKSLKEKEFMRDTFGKIVTPQVRDYLLGGNVALGGETLDVTVMFCDIRGFTSMSENMEPQKIVMLLNEYFTGLEKCITAHNGVINKYIGDAVMALFGAPIRSSTHANDAFEAALDMRKALVDINSKFSEMGFPQVRFGIGLHSGPVLAGNIGAINRMEYTVIGDTVNTASRIEGLCKYYKTDLLISQSTASMIENKNLRFVDDAEIRGRVEKVKLFSR